MMHMTQRRAIALLLPLSLVGCGGGSGTPGAPEFPPLRTSRTTFELVRGESATAEAIVYPAPDETTGTQTTLSTRDLPEGLVVTFEKNPLTIDRQRLSITNFTIVAADESPLGTSRPALVRTRGGRTAEAGLEVRVREYGVTVEVDSTDVDLTPGETEEVEVTVRRRGRANGIAALELTGDLPEGVDWRFEPSTVSVGPLVDTVRAKLILEASGDAPDGSQECRVRAKRGVNEDRSPAITVDVDAPDDEVVE